jgi:hypothetical protein
MPVTTPGSTAEAVAGASTPAASAQARTRRSRRERDIGEVRALVRGTVKVRIDAVSRHLRSLS